MSTRQVCSIAMVLLYILLLGCTTNLILTQATHKTIQIHPTAEGYELSVPYGKLVLVLPQDGFILEDMTLPEGASWEDVTANRTVNHPRYFALLRKRTSGGTTSVQRISGWFEPAEFFPGIQYVLDDVMKSAARWKYPPPQGVELKKINGWEVVIFDQDYSVFGATSSHIRANWVQAGTWIDIHLFMGSQLSREESRSQLIALLNSIKIRERP